MLPCTPSYMLTFLGYSYEALHLRVTRLSDSGDDSAYHALLPCEPHGAPQVTDETTASARDWNTGKEAGVEGASRPIPRTHPTPPLSEPQFTHLEWVGGLDSHTFCTSHSLGLQMCIEHLLYSRPSMHPLPTLCWKAPSPFLVWFYHRSVPRPPLCLLCETPSSSPTAGRDMPSSPKDFHGLQTKVPETSLRRLSM